MDPEEYSEILQVLADFNGLDTSSVTSTRECLLDLKTRREELIAIKNELKKDMRTVEIYYLKRRSQIRSEIEEIRNNSSKLKKIFGESPAAMQARAIREITHSRDAIIETYKELLNYTEELIDYTEELMVELYLSIRSSGA